MTTAAEIIQQAGLGYVLVSGGWHPDVEEALRHLGEIVRRNAIDALTRESTRTMAVEILNAGKIKGAARLVDAAIGKPDEGDRAAQGHEIPFSLPEPWSEPVDGVALFAEIKNFIQRYLIVPPGAIPVISAWSIATWAVEVFDIVPYLMLRSPTRECGKTRVLEVIELLARKAFRTTSASEAAIFRIIEKEEPTVLLDEAESLSRKSDPRSDAIIRLLNDGFERGPGVPRCEGEKNEVRFFRVFGFKAVASTERLWDTVESRSIVIRMQRKSRADNVERFHRKKARQEAHGLTRQIARWVEDHMHEIENAEPDLPDFLGDREQDIWECLLKVAQVISQDVYRELIEAARSLRREDEDNARRIQIVKDLKTIFTKEKMFSETICEELGGIEGGPWPEYRNGKRISQNQLANLLKDFDRPDGLPIRPKNIRIGTEQKKGYERAWFSRVFYIYTPDTPFEPSHPSQLSNDAGFSRFSNRPTDPGWDGPKNPANPHEQGIGTDGTDEKGVCEEKTEKKLFEDRF